MGTPEFAVASLEILIHHKVNVVAVITAPDKPKGRGRKLGTSPVKDVALAHNIPVLQPTNLKSPTFIEELQSYQADLQIVVAFRMLPVVVWDMPELGTFNLHASLLPQYRGAAPINWAIINGEKETGVTTFFLKNEIDTGNIIFQEKEPIHINDNVGSLYERLMQKGALLVLKTVQSIENEDYTVTKQNLDAETKHAPKIFKETCEINWQQSAKKVYDFIRGLSPYPAAWTVIKDKTYKIYQTEVIDRDGTLKPGEFETDEKTYLHIKSEDKLINIIEFQPQGKKRMKVGDFLRGNKIN